MQTKTLTPTVDSSTDFTSAAVDLGDTTTYSFNAIFSGSNVAGTFKLQVSNDGTNFIDLSGASSTITASGDALLNATDAGYRYVRYDWNYSSGTGNITVVFVSKGQLSKTRNRHGS
jgi:hypothetical protein